MAEKSTHQFVPIDQNAKHFVFNRGSSLFLENLRFLKYRDGYVIDTNEYHE